MLKTHHIAGQQLYLLAMILAAGCGLEATESDSHPVADLTQDAGHIEEQYRLADCDNAVGGIALPSDRTEATPGFDEELISLLENDTKGEYLIATESSFQRAVLAYAMEKPPAELAESVTRSQLDALGPIGDAVRGAFLESEASGEPGFDLRFLRRGLHRYYYCSRKAPLTLEDFWGMYPDARAPVSRLVDSSPKASERQLWENAEAGIYIAETLIGDTIRETEIILSKHRHDGALDFFVYNDEGRLMDGSTFATTAGGESIAAAPYACLACHVNRNAIQTIDLIHP